MPLACPKVCRPSQPTQAVPRPIQQHQVTPITVRHVLAGVSPSRGLCRPRRRLAPAPTPPRRSGARWRTPPPPGGRGSRGWAALRRRARQRKTPRALCAALLLACCARGRRLRMGRRWRRRGSRQQPRPAERVWHVGCCGGQGAPLSAAHSSGPRCAKCRSARRDTTMPLAGSRVAKLHLKAMSPSGGGAGPGSGQGCCAEVHALAKSGAVVWDGSGSPEGGRRLRWAAQYVRGAPGSMAMPAPMDSNAPLPR
jgi:hypothetical protein